MASFKKFRAWDKTLHQFVKPEHLYIELTGKLRSWGGAIDNPDRFVVQQYILTNEKGQDVYEGDIIASGKSLAVVEYIETEFVAMDITPNHGCNLLDVSCEVWGNIFENGDLITSQTHVEAAHGVCIYDEAWVGICMQKAVKGRFCAEHAAEKCRVCKGQATRSCEHTGSFVCGAPLCDTCKDSHGC